MTQAELADKVSKSRSAITNALRLLDLPEEVQELVYPGKMTAGHARAVLSVPDEAARIKLAAKIVDDGLSVREAENLARLYAAGQAERAPRPAAPKSFKVVARKLRRLLATNVRVRHAKDKGKIEIEFHGEEELERIFLLLTEGAASSEEVKSEAESGISCHRSDRRASRSASSAGLLFAPTSGARPGSGSPTRR